MLKTFRFIGIHKANNTFTSFSIRIEFKHSVHVSFDSFGNTHTCITLLTYFCH